MWPVAASLRYENRQNIIVVGLAAARVFAGTRNACAVEENSKSKINIGSRIPNMPAGTGDKQVHMVAIGVVVECQVRPRGPMVGLDCAFESSAVAPDQPKPSAGFPPVLNTQQASVVTAVPPGKTVTIASLDDPKTKHNLEISVHVDKEE